MNEHSDLVIIVAAVLVFAAGWVIGRMMGWERGFTQCSEIHTPKGGAR